MFKGSSGSMNLLWITIASSCTQSSNTVLIKYKDIPRFIAVILPITVELESWTLAGILATGTIPMAHTYNRSNNFSS